VVIIHLEVDEITIVDGLRALMRSFNQTS
jgi:hypothetical protein